MEEKSESSSPKRPYRLSSELVKLVLSVRDQIKIHKKANLVSIMFDIKRYTHSSTKLYINTGVILI